jgi:hypothetical protein
MTFMYALQAAVLDRRVYQNITEDREWFLRAFSTVLAAALLFGLGLRSISRPEDIQERFPAWLSQVGVDTLIVLLGISTVFLSWIMWSVIAYYIGSKLLRGSASYKLTLRSIGLAYGPGVFTLFIFWRVDLIMLVMLWILATDAIAIKETQKFGWFKSFIPVMFGWLFSWPFLFINMILPLFLTPQT